MGVLARVFKARTLESLYPQPFLPACTLTRLWGVDRDSHVIDKAESSSQQHRDHKAERMDRPGGGNPGFYLEAEERKRGRTSATAQKILSFAMHASVDEGHPRYRVANIL